MTSRFKLVVSPNPNPCALRNDSSVFTTKELKDHFVNLGENDVLDPNLTICARIRWLFRKREIAESRSKDITWPKVVMLYKNYRSMKDPQMQKFLRIYEALKTGDKSKLKK